MARGRLKPSRVNGVDPLSYLGVKAATPPNLVVYGTEPGPTNTAFDVGTIWINPDTDQIWMLEDIDANVASWIRIDTDDLVVNGNTGSATSVDAEMDIVGEGVLTTTGVDDELTIGHTAATDGQLIIGSTGNVPAWASLTSSGGTITVTAGSNTLNIDIAGGYLGAQDFDTDAGTATIAGNTITIAGGTNINTAGAGSTVTINLDTDITVNSVTATALGAGFLESTAGGLIQNSEGTDGQLIIGATGAPGAWANLTSASGTILITEGANTLNIESIDGLGAPWTIVYTQYGGAVTGAPTGISSSSGVFVVCTAAVAKINTSATGLTGTWTERSSVGGGVVYADIHASAAGPTVGVYTATVAAKSLNYAATPIGAYTEYAMIAAQPPNSLSSINFDGTYWMATGVNTGAVTNSIYFTTDPTSPPWTETTGGVLTDVLYESAFGNSTWVIVGENGFIAYNATDPVGAWTVVAAASNGFDATRAATPIHVYDVDYSSSLNLFCAVGSEGRIATSPDGITWTQRKGAAPYDADLVAVHWDSTNSIFIACSNSVQKRVIYSYDGINWEDHPFFSTVAGASYDKIGSNSGRLMVTASSTDFFVSR